MRVTQWLRIVVRQNRHAYLFAEAHSKIVSTDVPIPRDNAAEERPGLIDAFALSSGDSNFAAAIL
jgi:hypothetical protein